jgi:lipoprotein-anchoring transpeptidase ErfK/SrfK
MLQRRRRIAVAVGAGALVVGVAALGVASFSLVTNSPSAARPPVHHAPPPTTTTTTTIPAPVPGVVQAPAAGTLVATLRGSVPGYASPEAATSDMTVPGTWYGYPSILPVLATEPGWLYVRLAQRPNGSTIWVRQSDVMLSNTPYYIVVDLTTEHLLVFDDGTRILDFPAGVGAPSDPTPTGHYFMPMQYPSPGPGYGPFVLVTSDHSDTITDWENSGDAIIGIHGPITAYDDALIGTTGAAISHGCIRLHDADLAQLSFVPAGTPIDVIN